MKNVKSRRNFGILFCLTTVLALAVGLIIYSLTFSSLKDSVTSSLRMNVQREANSLGAIIDQNKNFLRLSAKIPELISSDALLIPDWFKTGQNKDFISRINRINTEGKAISGYGVSYFAGDRWYFHQALEGHEVIEAPILSRVDGQIVMVFAVPIFDRHNKVTGALTGTIDLNKVGLGLQGFYNQKMIEYGWIADGKALIYHTLQKPSLGSTFTPASNHPDLVTLTAPIPGTSWSVGMSASVKQFIQPLQTVFTILAFLWFFGFALALIILKMRVKSEDSLQQVKNESRKALDEAYDHIRQLAYYDPVTSLPNRHKINHILGQILAEGQEYTLVCLAIAKFRYLNTTFGLNFVDSLLREASQRLSAAIKQWPGSQVCRIGGNEFLVFFPGTIENDQRPAYLARVFQDPIGNKNLKVNLSIYLGACTIPAAGKTVEEVFKSVETAVWEAKKTFPKPIAWYSPEASARQNRKAKIEQALLPALKSGEFEVYYQPQIDLKSGDVDGYEALLRWNSSILGTVEPMEFIPIAEETGAIIPLGKMVLYESLSFIKALSKFTSKIPVVSVNVSAVQMLQSAFFDDLDTALKDTGVEPHNLGLEITESVLIESFDWLRPALESLMQRGVKVSLDDFGTGYSSLQYLRSLPLHVVKIDKTFLRSAELDQRSASLLSTIILLAHHLNLKVITEGVETLEQKSLLVGLDCDSVQGFLTGRPQPSQRWLSVVLDSAI